MSPELEAVREALAKVPLEEGLQAMGLAEGVFLAHQFPEVEPTEDGLACPWHECDGTEVEEFDRALRTNFTEYGDRQLTVSQSDSQFETLTWLCSSCQRPVEVPADSVEVIWQ